MPEVCTQARNRSTPRDGRRTLLARTGAGRALLRQARDWQQRVFLDMTAGWSATDRERFAGYLRRLVRQSQDGLVQENRDAVDLRHPPTPG